MKESKDFPGRLSQLVKEHQRLVPRLVEGVIKALGEEDGCWIHLMVDRENHVGVSYAHLIPGRVRELYQLPFGPKKSTRYEVEAILREDVWRARTLVLGLKRVLNLTEAPFEEKEFLTLYRKSVMLAWGGKLEKWWKHQVSWIFSRWRRNETPKAPDWWPYFEKEGYLLGGQFRKYQLLHLHSGSKKKSHELVAQSLLQIKRVADDVAVDFIKETLEKHRRNLTVPRTLPPKVVKSGKILESIVKTIDELVPRQKAEMKLSIRPASLRSHIESGRREHGAVGFLVKKYRLTRAECLLSMKEGLGGDVVSVYSLYDPEELRCAFMASLEGCFLQDLLEAEPVALCEPFKVRVITKGPAEAYWVAKSFQKKMHDVLRRHPTFELVGHPCSEEIMDRFLEKCKPTDLFCSGDYDQSTDNLDPDYSDFALCYLLTRLGCLNIPMGMRNALCGHRLTYESGSYPQVFGQLMGSPMSFPILCIMNAALSRLALDPELRTPLRRLPMLVNGDDILMGMSAAEYELWRGITAQGGLTPSVGKNYLDRTYCMINSEMYKVSRSMFHGFELRYATYCPFINLGLMKGEQKHRLDEPLFGGDEYARDLAGLAHSLVRGHAPEMADRLLSYFIADNREKLDSLPPGMSWFLPRTSGGYGLPMTRDFNPSAEQLKVAAFVRTGQGNLSLQHALSTSGSSELNNYERSIMERLGSEWVEDGGFATPGLIRVDWPGLDQEDGTFDKLQRVSTNFSRLRAKALNTSLHPMELDNAIETVKFGWSREVTINLPALKVEIV